eukprot:179934_1
MKMKSTGFTKVATEIAESDGEFDTVNNKTDNDKIVTVNVEIQKNSTNKKKVWIITLSIFGLLMILTAIAISIWFTQFNTPNPNRPASSIEKCDNLRCCKSKYSTSTNIDCASLKIEECVLNDDYCEWNCDPSTPSYLHRKFIKFDAGIGEIHDDEITVQNFDENKNVYSNKSDYQSVEECILQYQSESKMISYSECGDEYEVDVDLEIIKQRCNEQPSSGWSQINDNFTVDSEEERRRLSILSPDSRWEYTTKGIYPTKSVGVLVSSLGQCTATLISRRVIITAAQCIYDRYSQSFVYGWKFYPDATTSNDVWYGSYFSGGSSSWYAEVPAGYIQSGTYYENWGLIRLSTLDTHKSWISIGYDNAMVTPVTVEGISYPYPDKTYGTRWRQTCTLNYLSTYYMKSSSCDHAPNSGQIGEAMYKYVTRTDHPTPFPKILGIWNAHTSTANWYSRITQARFNVICDFISSGEASLC